MAARLPPPACAGRAGHSARGIKCIFGGMAMVEATVLYPIGSTRARPALGDDPDVEDDEVPLAAAIECDAPPWANVSTYFHTPYEASHPYEDRCAASAQADERAQCELDEPRTVCVKVTLNDDPLQHSDEHTGWSDCVSPDSTKPCHCVRYTYFDL